MIKEGGDNRKEGKGEESDDWVNELFGDITIQYFDDQNQTLNLFKGSEPIVEEQDVPCLLQHDYCTKEEVCRAETAEIHAEVKPLGHKSKPKKDLEVSFQEANDRREMHQFEELIKASSARREPTQVDPKTVEQKVKSGIMWSSCREARRQLGEEACPELAKLMTDFERLYNCSSLIEREAKEAKKVRHVEMDVSRRNGFLTVNVELKAVRDKVAADEKTLNSLDWSKGLQAIKKLLGPLIVTPEEEEVIIECEGQSQKSVSLMLWVTDRGHKHILANGVVPVEHHLTAYYLVLMRLFGEKGKEIKRHLSTAVLNQLVALEGALNPEAREAEKVPERGAVTADGLDLLDLVYQKEDEALNDPVTLMNLKNNEILALTEKLMRRNPSVMQINLLVAYQKMDFHLAIKGLKEILAGFYQLTRNFLERLEEFDMKVVRLKLSEEHYQTRIYVHSGLLKKNEKKELITLDYYSYESLMFAERITLLFTIYKEGLGNYTVKSFLLLLSNQATKNELSHQSARKLEEHNQDYLSSKGHSNKKDVNYDKISKVPQAIGKNTITTLYSANQPENSHISPETKAKARIPRIDEQDDKNGPGKAIQLKEAEILDDSIEILETSLGKRRRVRERSRSKEKLRARDHLIDCQDSEQQPAEDTGYNCGKKAKMGSKGHNPSAVKSVRATDTDLDNLKLERRRNTPVDFIEEDVDEITEVKQHTRENGKGKRSEQYSQRDKTTVAESEVLITSKRIVETSPLGQKTQQSKAIKNDSQQIIKAPVISKKVACKNKPKDQNLDSSSDSLEIEETRTGAGRKAFYNEEFFKKIELAVKLKNKLNIK